MLSYNVGQDDLCYCLSADRNSPYLLSDGPSLKKGPQGKRETRNTVVEPVKERYLIDLHLPLAFAC